MRQRHAKKIVRNAGYELWLTGFPLRRLGEPSEWDVVLYVRPKERRTVESLEFYGRTYHRAWNAAARHFNAR